MKAKSKSKNVEDANKFKDLEKEFTTGKDNKKSVDIPLKILLTLFAVFYLMNLGGLGWIITNDSLLPKPHTGCYGFSATGECITGSGYYDVKDKDGKITEGRIDIMPNAIGPVLANLHWLMRTVMFLIPLLAVAISYILKLTVKSDILQKHLTGMLILWVIASIFMELFCFIFSLDLVTETDVYGTSVI